ncbi:ABC transporter permease [Tamlana fucoidanivorans]|uniref:ABC transporter permease n=1 Tax=Allotamlana fucoidanivorans TaxID=2583814 RepID=A0A5C4SNM3_9FLAO|nr:ABC transporter permease [Tamlana fucoidanivorans]TNJ45779.1 ABC transporter permease [Tamlana fucoidanivorans]
MALETRIYQKDNHLKFGRLLKASVQDVLGSHFLAKQLALRDIKAQYRQSYFGILWAFVMPLTTAFVWIFLSSSGTVKLSDTGIPYPVYVFSGTLIWSVLKEAINTPTASTNSARGILSKINFPKEALVVSGLYKLLFSSSIKMVLLLILMLVYHMSLSWYILFFPLALLAAIFIGTMIGLFITPVSMLYGDVNKFISLGLSFVMYITPVVYAIPDSGIMKTLMLYNPLTPIIEVTRNVLTGGSLEFVNYYMMLLLGSIPLMCVALVWYRLSIPIIVERV